MCRRVDGAGVCVAPCRTNSVRFQIERPHEGVGHRPARLVLVGVEYSLYGQASLGGGATNGRQKQLPGAQRRAGAVATYETEETVFDRVPFRATRGVVAHG